MLSGTIISDLPITRWWGRVCIAWRDQTSAAKELWGGILTAIWPSDHTYLVKTVTDRIWATYSTTVSIGKVFGCTYSTTPSKGKVPLPPSPPSLNLLCPFGLSRRYFISDESSFEISCGWQERIILFFLFVEGKESLFSSLIRMRMDRTWKKITIMALWSIMLGLFCAWIHLLGFHQGMKWCFNISFTRKWTIFSRFNGRNFWD